jgi:hypothetical protein
MRQFIGYGGKINCLQQKDTSKHVSGFLLNSFVSQWTEYHASGQDNVVLSIHTTMDEHMTASN